MHIAILTHIQLSYKAGKIVVFEILRKYFPSKRCLVVNQKPWTTLQENENIDFEIHFLLTYMDIYIISNAFLMQKAL